LNGLSKIAKPAQVCGMGTDIEKDMILNSFGGKGEGK
jgi:hypothetical protein